MRHLVATLVTVAGFGNRRVWTLHTYRVAEFTSNGCEASAQRRFTTSPCWPYFETALPCVSCCLKVSDLGGFVSPISSEKIHMDK